MEDKIKHFIKNKNNRLFAVILILGIILMLVSGGDGKESKNTGSEEKRIERMLSKIDGIGDTDVFITYTEEKELTSTVKKATAAVITVENADDSYVKMTVSQATSAALEIPVHRVIILEKQK